MKNQILNLGLAGLLTLSPIYMATADYNGDGELPTNGSEFSSRSGYLEPVQAMPKLEAIDATYSANSSTNVRGGPSTKYKIVKGLQQGEEVRVLGRVVDKNWYMIAQNQIIQGFVHISLLDPVGDAYSYKVSQLNYQ